MTDRPYADIPYASHAEKPAGGTESRLLWTLARLLEIDATEVHPALDRAAQLVAEALHADKVDAFLHDATNDTLVAVGASDTPLARKQRSIGLDRLPIANGGSTAQVYLTGAPFLTGHAEQEVGEVPGIVHGLGVRSQVAAAFAVTGGGRGVLQAASVTPDFFSREDLAFLKAVAHWIGLVAQRAELVEQIARESAERGRQLAAEELITVLAHDLNNFLAPLKGRIDLIRRRARRENHPAYLDDADAAAGALARLSRLIGDLLDVRRVEEGLLTLNPRPFDLVALAEGTIDSLAAAQNPVQLHASGEVVVSADPDRIRQVLENLLTNALKHSPDTAPVDVTVATESDGNGQRAKVTVADRGAGIPPEVMSRLFTRFAAGPGSVGLGLGLYLACRIVAAHGGTLEVESSAGTGTQFCLTLPIQAMAADSPPLL